MNSSNFLGKNRIKNVGAGLLANTAVAAAEE